MIARIARRLFRSTVLGCVAAYVVALAFSRWLGPPIQRAMETTPQPREVEDYVDGALNHLGDADARRWVRVSTTAALAKVREQPLFPRPTDEQMRAVVEQWLGGLMEPDRQRLLKTMDNLLSAGADDACWMLKTQYARSLALPAADRVIALRLLTAYGQGPDRAP